jgi:hypothetical protein
MVKMRNRLQFVKPIEPNTVVALVDVDNWHFEGTSHTYKSTLVEIVAELLEKVVENVDDVESVQIRLYGGWTEDGLYTDIASEVAAARQAVDPFPIARGERDPLIRGDIHLATSLVSNPDVELGDLVRKRKGPPRIRLSPTFLNALCSTREDCPARILKRFTASADKKCPASGCEVRSDEVFSTRQQKMVDTLMACDLLELCRDDNVIAIFLVTSDSDFLPPLVQAARLASTRIHVHCNSEYWSDEALSIMLEQGVNYVGPRRVA